MSAPDLLERMKAGEAGKHIHDLYAEQAAGAAFVSAETRERATVIEKRIVRNCLAFEQTRQQTGGSVPVGRMPGRNRHDR